MPGTFPSLSTGKVAQYPLERRLGFSSEVVEFMNAGEQVYMDRYPGRRVWALEYSGLNGRDVKALQDHFESNQGRKGVFTFTDPWNNTVFTTCSFAQDELDIAQEHEDSSRVRLLIYEHP